MMSLSEQLVSACKSLVLKIEINYKLQFDDNSEILALAYIPHLGPPKGMLIFTDFKMVKPYIKKISALEYGFSILSEPSTAEDYNANGFIEIFSDWGWNGPIETKPVWMIDMQNGN